MVRRIANAEKPNAPQAHAPVLAHEVLAALNTQDGGAYVDGTFGAGGYSRLLLQAANCKVVAIDRDPSVAALAQAMQQQFPGRLHLITGNFGDMAELVPQAGFDAVDGVTLDLGVSSMQIDQAQRGFSFQADGPLDMRMSGEGPTAADAVNFLEQDALADVLYRYGEERKSRHIAKAIVAARQLAPITRTLQLAGIVAACIGGRGGKTNPATRTVQALRIYVNDELRELGRGLMAAERLLKPAGRLAVVSFHSLEDRIVKQFLAARCGALPNVSRHRPPSAAAPIVPSFKLLWSGARKPGAQEMAANPRARSARLRAAERTSAKPFGEVMTFADGLAPISATLAGRA